MNIKHTVYKASLVALLTGISLSSLADPTCAELMATGGGANVTAAIASDYSSTLLSTVNGCLTSYCASQSNAVQCQTNLTIAAYAITYAGVLQGYAPLNTFTPTPNPSSSSSSALPPQAPASLPEPTPPQDNNTSTVPGYVPTPQLSNNNANNPSNTNSNNNNISNNTRSYIRWY